MKKQILLRSSTWIWLAGLLATALIFDQLSELVYDIRNLWPFAWLALFGCIGIAFWRHTREVALATQAATLSSIARLTELRREFRICKPCSELSPSDFGFQIVAEGEEPDLHLRPINSLYISRRLRHRVAEIVSIEVEAEHHLKGILEENGSFILIGPPTIGKSRTMYEVLRQLTSHWVVVPKITHPSSNDAFEILGGQNVIVMIEDINGIVGSQVDLADFVQKVASRASSVAVAVTCRSGAELKSVTADTSAGVGKFYESIVHHFELSPLSAQEKHDLAASVHLELLEGDEGLYPTPGTLTMSTALAAMKLRFERLSYEQSDVLRSIKLMMAAGIVPFTHDRLNLLMTDLYHRRDVNLRDLLDGLAREGFLRLPADQDPIDPEPAYFRDEVFRYHETKLESDDFPRLVEVLVRSNDWFGLFYLGLAALPFDLSLAEKASRLAAENGIPAAYNNLGVALENQVGKLPEAREVYEVAVSKGIVPAWLNLGNVLRNLGNIKEAEDAYLSAIRLGDPNAFLALGNMLAWAGDRFEDAERSFRTAIEKGDSLRGRNALGNLYAMNGKDEDARKEYLHALGLGHKLALVGLGKLAAKDPEKIDQAIGYFQQAIENGYPIAGYDLWLLLFQIPGRQSEAKEALKVAADSGEPGSQFMWERHYGWEVTMDTK